MWEAVALAVGLAMDATAVAAARGVSPRRRELIVLPLMFGGFQAGMAALGWLVAARGAAYLDAWDHWIAFVLLLGIGAKLLVDAWRGGGEPADPRSGLGIYLALSLATSVDAAAAGITLPLVPVTPWVTLALIGVVTAALSATGYAVGRAIGHHLGAKLEVLGGLVLIGLGVRVLAQHL